jgi:choline monooxygenase
MSKITNSIYGLSAKSYTDQQFWEIECNTVLAEGWLFVGFVHEFFKSGDVILNFNRCKTDTFYQK